MSHGTCKPFFLWLWLHIKLNWSKFVGKINSCTLNEVLFSKTKQTNLSLKGFLFQTWSFCFSSKIFLIFGGSSTRFLINRFLIKKTCSTFFNSRFKVSRLSHRLLETNFWDQEFPKNQLRMDLLVLLRILRLELFLLIHIKKNTVHTDFPKVYLNEIQC